MKTKLVLLLAATLALATAGVALGKVKPPAKSNKAPVAAKVKKPAAPKGFQAELQGLGISCPKAAVSLQGSFGGAGGGFLALVVSKATGKASPLVGKQVALRLLHSTKIERNGPTLASKLKQGEHLDVVALMCSQGLVARNVTAAAKKH